MLTFPKFSINTFKGHVKAVEGRFSKRDSGMDALVKLLETTNPGSHESKFSLKDYEQVQQTIWRVGVRDDPWHKTKQRYAKALGYLVEQMFAADEGRGPSLTAGDALLLGEYKKNWSQWSLLEETAFVHRSSVTVRELRRSRGFSTRFASEVCIPDGGLVGDWPLGNKFIFTMKARFDEKGKLVIGSGGKLKHFGFGDVFVIKQPAGTPYMSDYRVTSDEYKGGQVAFAGDIPLARITVYKGNKPVEPRPW